jgi:hypothetical protein
MLSAGTCNYIGGSEPRCSAPLWAGGLTWGQGEGPGLGPWKEDSQEGSQPLPCPWHQVRPAGLEARKPSTFYRDSDLPEPNLSHMRLQLIPPLGGVTGSVLSTPMPQAQIFTVLGVAMCPWVVALCCCHLCHLLIQVTHQWAVGRVRDIKAQKRVTCPRSPARRFDSSRRYKPEPGLPTAVFQRPTSLFLKKGHSGPRSPTWPLSSRGSCRGQGLWKATPLLLAVLG